MTPPSPIDRHRPCDLGPQNFVGDGTYMVEPGDSIEASNGIHITLTNRELAADSGPRPEEIQALYAQVHAGHDQLNLGPYKIFSQSCKVLYGVTIRGGQFQHVDACGRVSLKVASLFPGPIHSRQDLHVQCMNYEPQRKVHGNMWPCEGYIPWQPSVFETLHENGKFRVIAPPDLSPVAGEFLVQQLEACYTVAVDTLGIHEVAPYISLRLYNINDPLGGLMTTQDHTIFWPLVPNRLFLDQQLAIGYWPPPDSAGICHIPTLAHELGHLIAEGIDCPHFLREGVADIVKQKALENRFQGRLILASKGAFGDTLTLPVSGETIMVGTTNLISGTVTLIRNSVPTQVAFETYTVYSSTRTRGQARELVTVGWDGSVKVYLTDYYPFMAETVFGDTGYTVHPNRLYIDGEYYHNARGDERAWQQQYVSLSPPRGQLTGPGLYPTGRWAMTQLTRRYGTELLRAFHQAGEAARSDNLAGGSAQFCWAKTLTELTGSDLTTYFGAFDVKADPKDCRSWVEFGTWRDNLLQSEGCP